MVGAIGNIGNSNEPYALVMGIIAIISAVLFFLQRFNIITIFVDIPEEIYLYFFAGFTLLSGIIHLFTTLGFIGSN